MSRHLADRNYTTLQPCTGRPSPSSRTWAAAKPPEIGAWVLRTDTELLLKSRYVVPGRLLDAGFAFAFPEWAPAAAHLVAARR